MTKPLDFLSNHLGASGVTPNIQRNDEMSGSGSGQFWSAELATPLWTFTVSLKARQDHLARAIDARVWSLGVNKPFLFADPSYRGPASGDPGSAATVSAISADRTAIGLAGLPAGFEMNFGDRISMTLPSGRVYLGSFVGSASANGSGNTVQIEVFPPVPLSLSTGQAVELVQPVMKAIIPPGGYTAFSAILGHLGQGASLTILQKV